TLEPPVREAQVPVGRKVFLAVVLSQLFSIALIFGWYFYTLRSELGSLTRQRAQEAVLQSIAATENYFNPAEIVVEAGQLLRFRTTSSGWTSPTRWNAIFLGSFDCGRFWRVSILAIPQANSSTSCAATRRLKAAPAPRESGMAPARAS